jgi:D-threo-aldose 1-dehydrogenase
MTSRASALPRRRFGHSELEVTPLCIGGTPREDLKASGVYPAPQDRHLATFRAVFNSPINFLDTAAAYGDGESERRIGAVLRELGGLPDGFVLATKADRDMQTGDFSAGQTRRSVQRSLELLGVDHLQIVFLHDPEFAIQTYEEVNAPGGAVEQLVRLKEEGVIGVLGISGGPIDMLMRYVDTGVWDAVISHNRYTLLSQVADPLFTQASQRGLAVLNAAPYASGILAKGPDARQNYVYRDAPADVVGRTRELQAVCADYGVPLAAVALQFSLRDPRITSTIVGATRPERIQETLALAQLSIPEEVWTRVKPLAIANLDPQF